MQAMYSLLVGLFLPEAEEYPKISSMTPRFPRDHDASTAVLTDLSTFVGVVLYISAISGYRYFVTRLTASISVTEIKTVSLI